MPHFHKLLWLIFMASTLVTIVGLIIGNEADGITLIGAFILLWSGLLIVVSSLTMR